MLSGPPPVFTDAKPYGLVSMMVTLCYHFPMNTFVDDVLDACRQSGQAYCKFLSPNDTGKTRSHQAGTYIKKDFGRQWIPPEKGCNIELDVMVRWIVPHQERLVTTSRLKWYGAGTRSEHRLTRFGQGFPFRDINYTGSLMVMVPTGGSTFDIFLVENRNGVKWTSLVIHSVGQWGHLDGRATTRILEHLY